MTIFNKTLRVAYYARVSTHEEGQISSLENQKNHYENMINQNKNWTLCKGYIDEGISGVLAGKRENFQKMISDAKNGLFDLIITKEISRFSRNTLESISYTRTLLKYNVGVYFENDGISTLSSDGELRLTIMSAIYQDEVRRISERVKFGLSEALKNQKVLGTNTIGYVKKDGVLLLDEEGAKVVKEIFHLYVDKKIGIRQISLDLASQGYFNTNGNPYSFSSIRNILTNPKYKGYYCGRKYENVDIFDRKKVKLEKEKWILKKDENIPKIIDEDMWDRANKLLSERRGDKNSFSTKYAFSGKIYCKNDLSPLYRTVICQKEAWKCKEKRENKCKSPIIYTSEIVCIIEKILDIDYEKIKMFFKNALKNAKIKNNNCAKIKSALKSLFENNIISKDEYKEKLNEIKLKTTDNNTGKEINIDDIILNKKDVLFSDLIEKVYISTSNGYTILNIELKNYTKYNVKYIKKGSRILSEPVIEKVL